MAFGERQLYQYVTENQRTIPIRWFESNIIWSPTSSMQNAKVDFLGEKASSHYINQVNEQPTCSNAFEIKADVKQRSLKRNDISRMEVLPRSTCAEEASTWLIQSNIFYPFTPNTQPQRSTFPTAMEKPFPFLLPNICSIKNIKPFQN
jgi:hypothetical protein